MHIPAPLHVDAAARFCLPLQAAGAHVVPAAYSAQAPAPLQVPFVPHVEAAVTAHMPRGSDPPAGTGAHVPIEPATEHEKQLGQPAVPQHTCPTQCALAHCASAVHDAPFGFRLAQLPATHDEPDTQSPSPAQAVRHAPPAPHTKGLQLAGVCTQEPVPLQKPAGVNVEPAHDAAPHAVVAGATLHAPAPLHVPVRPQGGLGAQRPCGSASSAGTSLHAPARPSTLQDWHVPQPEAAQHTPSTQNVPVRQSSVDAQV
jgi:hypothetical protein